jgi:hypothetical protein
MSAQDLRDKIHGYPGLQEKDTVNVLGLLGVHTLEQLGRMSDYHWKQCISCIPQMRIDHPEDLTSKESLRFGPGHLNSLDEIRAEAKKAFERKRRVRAENRTYTRTVQLTNEIDLSILDDTASCDADIDSESSIGTVQNSFIDMWNIVNCLSDDESCQWIAPPDSWHNDC